MIQLPNGMPAHGSDKVPRGVLGVSREVGVKNGFSDPTKEQ